MDREPHSLALYRAQQTDPEFDQNEHVPARFPIPFALDLDFC